MNTLIRRNALAACLIWLGYLIGAPAAFAGGSARERPNILLILADDMGFADLNINLPATHAPTPRLDRLAREGVRFSRHYADSSCSPARAALLTGRYPARSGFKPNAVGIPSELVTLPELFKSAGYRTHQIGKWHLGHYTRDAWPDRQGFDTWLGYLNQWLTANASAGTGKFRFEAPTHIDAFLQNESGVVSRYPGHLTDVLTEHAATLISAARGAPWFIYLAYSAPHTPIQPSKEFAARFPDDPAGRYRAMLAQLDDRIGSLLDLIDSTGQRDRTIVVFASDNGGTNAEIESNAPFPGRKMDFLEGGLRTPLLMRWPGRLAAGTVVDTPVSIMDIYPTLAVLAGLPAIADADVDGVALFQPNGELTPIPPRSLFWESEGSAYASYGALSLDGRQRLYKSAFGGPVFYDLARDPTGRTTAPATEALMSEFQRWHAWSARLQLDWTPTGTSGHGVLTGDQFQRSAGLGEFTIGLGVVPDAIRPGRQVLLSQEPAAEIVTTDSGISIRLQEFAFDLPPLQPGRCNSLLLTGIFLRRLWLPTGSSQVEVYRDGNLVASAQQPTPAPPRLVDGPTFIGQDEHGGARFSGRISPVIFLNRRADGSRTPEFTPGTLSHQLCDGLATE